MNTCQIPDVYEVELFECLLHFCLWGLTRNEFTEQKWLHQTNCSLAFCNCRCPHTKKRKDHLGRTTGDLRTQVANCIKRDIEIL